MKLIVNKEIAHLMYDAVTNEKDSLHRTIKEMNKQGFGDSPALNYAYNKYGNLQSILDMLDMGIMGE